MGKTKDLEMVERIAMQAHRRWWSEEISYGVEGRPVKTIYCMKPPRGKRSLHFLQNNEIYHGRQWGIDGCLICEARVKLDCAIYAEKYVASAKLHPEARMRCDWFRQWATDYPGSLLIMMDGFEQRIKKWRDLGKRRVEWLNKQLFRFVHFEGNMVTCPFCNSPWDSLPGDHGSMSFNNKFDSWPKLAQHINEFHGLVRIVKSEKKSSRLSWQIRYNKDEPYDFELPDISIDVVDLSKLIGESDPNQEKPLPKFKRIKSEIDLKSLL